VTRGDRGLVEQGIQLRDVDVPLDERRTRAQARERGHVEIPHLARHARAVRVHEARPLVRRRIRKKRARFRGGARLSTWLARIVINEAYGRLRKQKQSAVIVPFEAGDRDAPRMEEETMADETTEQPEAGAMRAELRQLLERQIDALPEQFRTVFILREVEEMSVEEAAECLNVPPATVRTRAFRARAMLRESLSREIDVATVNVFGFGGERCDRIVASVLERLRLDVPSP